MSIKDCKDCSTFLRLKKLEAVTSELENIMDRWHHGRDNDRESLEKINNILMDELGWLEWFR